MATKPHFHHPADNFSHTILRVNSAALTELREPVSAPLSADASEQLSHFKFRLATTHGRKQLARMLVQKMYATRGYETEAIDTTTAPEAASPTQKVETSGRT